VRALAAALNLPGYIVNREPFPGPGLFIRILGGKPTPKRLNLLRWADSQVRRIIHLANLPDLAQLVIALDCTQTSGVKGDAGVQLYGVRIRPVKSLDFMTAAPLILPPEIRAQIVQSLTQHEKIGPILFDETPKPPCCVEYL